MTTRSWLRTLFNRKTRPLAARPRTRPRLEVLEDRLAPAVLTVNSTADDVTSDSLLTLREALSLVSAAGNATAALGRSLTAAEAAQITGPFGSADAIGFAPGLSGPLTLQQGYIGISKSVTLTGPAGGLTIDGHLASRIFLVDDGTAAAIDVAISGLTLTGGRVDVGGAIYNTEDLSLTNCTLSGNSAAFGGGIYNSGTATLNNSIVANSPKGGDVYILNTGILGGSHNLIGIITGTGTNALTGTLSGDPLLGPLQDNGGPTQTMALLPGSPALDAGSSSGAPLTDQRGVPRDAQPDLGGALPSSMPRPTCSAASPTRWTPAPSWAPAPSRWPSSSPRPTRLAIRLLASP